MKKIYVVYVYLRQGVHNVGILVSEAKQCSYIQQSLVYLTILEAAPTVTICDGAPESVYVLWNYRNHRCIIIIIKERNKTQQVKTDGSQSQSPAGKLVGDLVRVAGWNIGNMIGSNGQVAETSFKRKLFDNAVDRSWC